MVNSVRGRGSMISKPSFSLDNRPTTLSITNLPLELKSEEALKNHFKVIFFENISLFQIFNIYKQIIIDFW